MTTAKFHQLNDFVQVGSEMVTGMNCMDPKIRTSFEYFLFIDAIDCFT